MLLSERRVALCMAIIILLCVVVKENMLVEQTRYHFVVEVHCYVVNSDSEIFSQLTNVHGSKRPALLLPIFMLC